MRAGVYSLLAILFTAFISYGWYEVGYAKGAKLDQLDYYIENARLKQAYGYIEYLKKGLLSDSKSAFAVTREVKTSKLTIPAGSGLWIQGRCLVEIDGQFHEIDSASVTEADGSPLPEVRYP